MKHICLKLFKILIELWDMIYSNTLIIIEYESETAIFFLFYKSVSLDFVEFFKNILLKTLNENPRSNYKSKFNT